MKLGFLYAGQGSQHAGMGADLYEAFSAFRAVYDHAEVDFDLKKVTFEDPDGIINQTRYTQPCMVAFAAGMTAVLREKGITCLAAALYQSQPLSAAEPRYPGGVCVVIGSEGQGLTEETIRACNGTVRIPMTDRVESLNAGIAGSILLWHFREESL